MFVVLVVLVVSACRRPAPATTLNINMLGANNADDDDDNDGANAADAAAAAADSKREQLRHLRR